MKTTLKIYLATMACATSLSAFAANNGCHTQGVYTGNGFRSVDNYCLANRGESDQLFKQMCQDLFESGGGGVAEKGEVNTRTLKFVSSCPRASSGVCEGIFGFKIDEHILPGNDWGKDMMNALGYKKFCEISEGKWKP